MTQCEAYVQMFHSASRIYVSPRFVVCVDFVMTTVEIINFIYENVTCRRHGHGQLYVISMICFVQPKRLR